MFVDKAPNKRRRTRSAIRCCARCRSRSRTGRWCRPAGRPIRDDDEIRAGNGLIRPLEAAARKAGVEILLEHRMTAIHRETPKSGRVARHRRRPQRRDAQHPRAQGGDRRHRRLDRQRQLPPHVRSAPDRGILRPRRHAVVGPGRQRRARRDGGRRLAVGRCSTRPANSAPASPSRAPSAASTAIVNLRWIRAARCSTRPARSGSAVADWQDVILVNMLGRRFYDETGGQFTANNYKAIDPYAPGSYLNAKNHQIQSEQFHQRGAGRHRRRPQWRRPDLGDLRRRRGRAREMESARRRTSTSPPDFFFSADTLAELARKIEMKYQRVPMPPQNLAATVARYNAFVDAGKDADFGKPKPLYKIAKPPFYAAWATPVDPRHPRRPAHQRALPGDRHERRGHPRPLLRRRIGRRLQPARPAARHLPGLHRRTKRGDAERRA